MSMWPLMAASFANCLRCGPIAKLGIGESSLSAGEFGLRNRGREKPLFSLEYYQLLPQVVPSTNVILLRPVPPAKEIPRRLPRIRSKRPAAVMEILNHQHVR